MSNLSDINWTRLEDILQSNENLRAGNRIEPPNQVDGEEVWDQSVDPWAFDLKPWPAPPFVGAPDNPSDVGGVQNSPRFVTDKINGVK